MARDFGSINVKGTASGITFVGTINDTNTLIYNGYNNYDLTLDKENYKVALSFLQQNSSAPTVGCQVISTINSNEACSIEGNGTYTNFYSRISGAAYLSGNLFGGFISLANSYITGSKLRYIFYNSSTVRSISLAGTYTLFQ